MWNNGIDKLSHTDSIKIKNIRKSIENMHTEPTSELRKSYLKIRSKIFNFKHNTDNMLMHKFLNEANNKLEGAMRILNKKMIENKIKSMEKSLMISNSTKVVLYKDVKKPDYRKEIQKISDVIKNSSSCKLIKFDYDDINLRLFIIVECFNQNNETLKIVKQLGYKGY